MVNQSNIFKKIGYILNELQDQYQFLSENPDQLSELELELFLANANFLSDHVQIVKKLNGSGPLKELPQTASQEPEQEPKEELEEEILPVESMNAQSQPKIKTEDFFKIDEEPSTFEFVISENSSPAPSSLEEVVEDNHHEEMVDYVNENDEEVQSIELLDDPIEPMVVVEEYVEDEVGPEPFLVSKEEEKVTADAILIEDKVAVKTTPESTPTLIPEVIEEEMTQPASQTSTKPTLNDLLATRNLTNVNEANISPVVTDLKKAVNLNEKLLYIKDLFNGYNLAYSEAIDILNKLSDFRSADNFLKNNYAVKNNWEAKQSTVDKFYELLRQRFPEG